jgi:hypothetical protein
MPRIPARDPKTGRIISTQSIEERFWGHVQICEHGRSCKICCWPWTAKIDDGGYGHFAVTSKRDALAHRYAYQLIRGFVLPGMLICHDCPKGDLRSCCNPAHLRPGTNMDNMRDARDKGRFSTGPRSEFFKMRTRNGIHRWMKEHPERHAHGAKSGNAKLDDAKALAIFLLKGHKPSRAVAKEFGVSKPIILGIWNKTGWKHIHQPLLG